MKPRWTWPLLLLLAGCSHKPPYEGRSVAELEHMLDDPDTTVQVQGAYGLSQHGAEAASAVPALVRILRSPDALVRQEAALALGHIGVAEEAVPALAAALSDSEWTVRRQAAMALGQIGPAARAAEPDLRRCRRDPHTLVRKAVEEALGKISEAVPTQK
jgi:HEAT repeat protein